MAIDDFLGKKWEDRTTGGKILYGAGLASGFGLYGAGANEAAKIWKGDTERLDEINKLQSEAENSPYNEAKLSKENQDYYDTLLSEYNEAKRNEKYGLTPQEKAAANQDYAQSMNLGAANALNANPNLSTFITSNLNANQGKFSLNLAAQDAELKRGNKEITMRYLNMLQSPVSDSQNALTQNFNKQIMTDQALGQAEIDWYNQRDANRQALINTGLSVAGTAAGTLAGMPSAGAAAGGAIAPTVSSSVTSKPSWKPNPSPYNPNWSSGVTSDERLKKNIVYLKTENGHKLYEFEYKNEPNIKYIGVIAQEVMKTNPEAVLIGDDGYYKVLYNMLGIEMKKLN